MTTMDSDSESQDSDDGRRFRFEATRKDANAHLEARSKIKSSRQRLKETSHYNDADYRDKKERSKYESNRKDYRSSKDHDTNSKDFKHTIKHSKHTHESRSSRHEDGKDHRDTRDIGLGSKNSGLPLSKQKSRDSKHDKNRDRSEHRKHRSQERSHDRSQDDRSLTDKHKNKSYEKYKHHSHEKNRDRDYQSNKLKPSDCGTSRNEHKRHDSHKRISVKENENQQHLTEYSPLKSTEQAQSDSEILSNKVSKRDLSVDSQECKDLDLSEFDVLSETDENFSDVSDIRSQNSLPRYRKTKVKKRDSADEYENSAKKEATKSEQHLEEYHKVNARKTDPSSGSNNNNPSAISDFLLGSASSITSAMTEGCVNDDGKRPKDKSKDEIANFSSKEENPNSVEETSLHFNSHGSSKEILKSEEDTSGSLASIAEITNSAYGPALPPQFSFDSSDTCNDRKSPSSTKRQIENETAKIESNAEPAKNTAFIGPCLPPKDVRKLTTKSEDDTNDHQIPDYVHGLGEPSIGGQNFEEEEDSAEDVDITFGPALPPHLLQQRCDSEARNQIIGPVLPSATHDTSNDVEPLTRHSESEDDDAIGPLPMDHPALKNSYVHEQLEQRARKIKYEQNEEGSSVLNQREEWMTELPPAQASNLGLGPRKFRVRAGPDMSDRSCWTDTPAKRAEKQKKREEERLLNAKAPDPRIDKESYVPDSGKSRKREKSLLDIHQTKLHKKKKKEEKEAKLCGQKTRRPFDRDIDLKANQFDQAQKKTILMKAQLLDERFSRGKI